MLSKFSCLGTGKLEINQININDISSSEALGRLRLLEAMVLMAPYKVNQQEALLEIANFSLKGQKEVNLSKECFNLTIDNVDIYELNEKGIKERYKEIKEYIDIINCPYGFLQVSRVALTGVPF